MMRSILVLVAAAACAALGSGTATAQDSATPRVPARPPAQDYLVYTVAESADQLALVRFGP